MRVPELLHLSASQFPSQVAVYDEFGTFTYRELSDLVKQITADLKVNGIVAATCVGVMGKNSREFIAMVFAVMECGAVVMPISNQVSQTEFDDIRVTAKLSMLLDDGSTEYLTSAKATVLKCNNQQWNCSTFSENNAVPFAIHVADPALIRFTSGTTGSSKGVILSHQTILERTAAANKLLQLGVNDKVVWVLSMAYHFVVSIILYLRYGCSIIVCNDFMATTIIEQANRHLATFLYASPLHIRMLSTDTSSWMMPSLKRVISTSTAISREICIAFKNRFNIDVSQAYGIIEIGLPIINFEKSELVPDAVGYALPDYTVEILDDTGSILPANHTGHLAIKGPGMLDGYLSPPKIRDEILNNGWFMTGDLATKLPDGLIKIDGRLKSMINVAGNKVFPEEVEQILDKHPDISESKVSGYQHKLLGEAVKAEIVLNSNIKNYNVEGIRQFCRKHLSSYKIPQQIIVVNEIPKTDSGKVKRGEFGH